MDGGAGDDTFYTPGWNAGDKGSGGGVDTLTGGAGRDTYHLSAHYARQAPTLFHVDIITDFAAGSDGDVLDLTNVVGYLEGYTSGNPYETGHLRVVADGTDTLVQMDWTGSGVDQSYVTLIRLQNVQPSDLTRYNLGVPPVSILGTSGDDTLVGTAYSDVFEGYDGNDTAVFLGNRDQYVVTV
jgi:Ca2+-binding RTX toxin-like protein